MPLSFITIRSAAARVVDVADVLPSKILSCKPIIFDVNYFPKTTKLTQQGIDNGCKTVKGIEMLIYQAIEQNKIWTQNEINFEKIKNFINYHL